MCDQVATTVEHVPPRCIFPERSDTGTDYRKNLITVPSCEEHNLKKSNDDEFLMTLICGHVKNNSIGYIQTKTKLRRSVTNNRHLVDSALKDVKSFDLKSQNGTVFSILSGKPDMDRFTKCIKQISYGLYFKEFGHRFQGSMVVIYEFEKYIDPEIDEVRATFVSIYDKEVALYPVKGANPKVFFYQITPPNNFGIVGLRMTFYEGTHIQVSMGPSKKT